MCDRGVSGTYSLTDIFSELRVDRPTCGSNVAMPQFGDTDAGAPRPVRTPGRLGSRRVPGWCSQVALSDPTEVPASPRCRSMTARTGAASTSATRSTRLPSESDTALTSALACACIGTSVASSDGITRMHGVHSNSNRDRPTTRWSSSTRTISPPHVRHAGDANGWVGRS